MARGGFSFEYVVYMFGQQPPRVPLCLGTGQPVYAKSFIRHSRFESVKSELMNANSLIQFERDK